MADFPSRLAERIEASPLFRAALTELQQQSLAPLMGYTPKLAPLQTEKLSQAAVALARSSEPKHVGLAQEIAYSLAACSAESGLRGVWRHVLAEIGNFPAGDYISGNSVSNENLPWMLRLREASRRRENTVSVLGKEIVFTDFQADVWWRLSAYASQPRELPIQRHVVQRLFHRHVRQPEPLLQKVDAQHRFDWKRLPTRRLDRRMRRYQRQKRLPRHHTFHLIQKYLLARASVAQVQAKVALFHGFIQRCEPSFDCPRLREF